MNRVAQFCMLRHCALSVADYLRQSKGGKCDACKLVHCLIADYVIALYLKHKKELDYYR